MVDATLCSQRSAQRVDDGTTVYYSKFTPPNFWYGLHVTRALHTWPSRLNVSVHTAPAAPSVSNLTGSVWPSAGGTAKRQSNWAPSNKLAITPSGAKDGGSSGGIRRQLSFYAYLKKHSLVAIKGFRYYLNSVGTTTLRGITTFS